jgi:hypothetical protein
MDIKTFPQSIQNFEKIKLYLEAMEAGMSKYISLRFFSAKSRLGLDMKDQRNKIS